VTLLAIVMAVIFTLAVATSPWQLAWVTDGSQFVVSGSALKGSDPTARAF
jgi:hypothetical protein